VASCAYYVPISKTNLAAVLHHRLLVSTILIAGLVGLCWLDASGALGALPGAWLFPLAIVFGLLASAEIILLLSAAGQPTQRWLVIVGNFFVIAANGLPLMRPLVARSILDPLGWPMLALSLAVLASLACEVLIYKPGGNGVSRVAATTFSLVYVGGLMSFIAQLAIVSGGLVGLLSLIIVVKMADTGAYTVGRLIGRHKMTPRLSPGKTWEGAGGAAIFALIGAGLAFEFLAPRLNPEEPAPAAWRWISYALVVAIAGTFGDLAESLLKREAGVKNSSSWMPGLGGVLDVLDSILFAAPVAYACWAFGLLS
jgi:phosphatidate cytidylyltransferase